jgi:hypothetical protein
MDQAMIDDAEQPFKSRTWSPPGFQTARPDAAERVSQPTQRPLFTVANGEDQKGISDMTGVQDDKRPIRLEYFIHLARRWEKTRVEIDLRTAFVEQKVSPDETDDMTGMPHMCLPIGNFLCECGEEVSTISKIYAYGSTKESMLARQVSANLANARLKMDYQRLKGVKISFEEKYFCEPMAMERRPVRRALQHQTRPRAHHVVRGP